MTTTTTTTTSSYERVWTEQVVEAMGVEAEPKGGPQTRQVAAAPNASGPLPGCHGCPNPSLERGAAALIRLMLIRRYPSAAPSLLFLMGLEPPSRAAPCEIGTLHRAVVPLAGTKRPGSVLSCSRYGLMRRLKEGEQKEHNPVACLGCLPGILVAQHRSQDWHVF